MKVEEAARINNIPVIRIWSQITKSHGLVSIVKGKFYCYCCLKNYCEHCKATKTLCEEGFKTSNVLPILEELWNIHQTESADPSQKVMEKDKCHSFHKIPFTPSTEGMAILRDGVHIASKEMVFMPEHEECRHCGGLLANGDPVEKEWIAKEDVTFVTNTFLGTARGRFKNSNSNISKTVLKKTHHSCEGVKGIL